MIAARPIPRDPKVASYAHRLVHMLDGRIIETA